MDGQGATEEIDLYGENPNTKAKGATLTPCSHTRDLQDFDEV